MLGLITSRRPTVRPAEAGQRQTHCAALPDVRPVRTAVRINTGGAGLTDAEGRSWDADTSFSGGSVDLGKGEVEVEPTPFKSRRYGTYFVYSLAAPDGQYTLKLHFTDPVKSTPGRRKLDVMAGGRPLLTDFDIAAAAPAPGAVVTRSFPVRVMDGRLRVEFIGKLDKATVSGIELEPA